MKITLLLLIALALLTVAPSTSAEDRSELEAELEATLNGARLVGHFTVSGADGVSLPQDDSYNVSRISKLEDGRWQPVPDFDVPADVQRSVLLQRVGEEALWECRLFLQQGRRYRPARPRR